MTTATLNEDANRLADQVAAAADAFRVAVLDVGGGRVIDCGVQAAGGVQAGLALARICLAGRAEVCLTPGTQAGLPFPDVQVSTDQPVLACLASQYAGWKVSVGGYFGMGSGPMRAAAGKEKLFADIPGKESPPVAVGVLESGKVPTPEVVAALAGSLGLPAGRLTLLVAPTSSQAGTLQVVARALETTMHKLHELRFDPAKVVSGYGAAPLAPVALKDIQAIGRTNDAILYGGRAVLWVRADDAEIAEIGPKVPSSASSDYGAPFAEIFKRAGNDFYQIDPLLFSPAQVVFNNLTTGRCFVFGRCRPEILERSFVG